MPLYEYQCTACGHRFEVIRKFSDVPLTECPRCKGQVEKLISSPAFHLKGSGWYATDYAKKPEGSKTDTKGEGKTDGKGEGKGESKADSGESKSTEPKGTESKSKESTSGDSGAKDSTSSTSKSSS